MIKCFLMLSLNIFYTSISHRPSFSLSPTHATLLFSNHSLTHLHPLRASSPVSPSPHSMCSRRGQGPQRVPGLRPLPGPAHPQDRIDCATNMTMTMTHCTALHCTALYCTELHCTTLQRTVMQEMIGVNRRVLQRRGWGCRGEMDVRAVHTEEPLQPPTYPVLSCPLTQHRAEHTAQYARLFVVSASAGVIATAHTH